MKAPLVASSTGVRCWSLNGRSTVVLCILEFFFLFFRRGLGHLGVIVGFFLFFVAASAHTQSSYSQRRERSFFEIIGVSSSQTCFFNLQSAEGRKIHDIFGWQD